MQPVNEKESAIHQAGTGPVFLSVISRFSVALFRLFRTDHDAENLPDRLRRDAGLDDLERERKRIARAPLIR